MSEGERQRRPATLDESAPSARPLDDLFADPRVARLTASGRALWYELDGATGEIRWVGRLFTQLGIATTGDTHSFAWWLDRVHPDDRHLLTEFIPAAAATPDESHAIAYRVRRADDSYAFIEGYGTLFADAAGRVRINGVLTDVSEAREAEAALRASEQMFRSIAESARDVIVRMSPSGVYEYVSPAVVDIFGYTPDEVCGKSPFDFLHLDDHAALAAGIARVIAGEDDRVTYRFLHKDGTDRWLETTARPHRDATGAIIGIVAVARDITERRAMAARVAAADRLDAIGRVAGGIAHDFANLLQVVQANLELLADGIADAGDSAALVREAQDALTRAVGLNGQLLALGRRQVLAPTVVDLRDVLARVRPLLERTLGAGIRLAIGLPATACPARVDASQLERVLLNVVGNARDALRGAGAIAIDLAPVRTTTERLHPHGVVPPGDWQVMTIRDDGPGMTPAILAQVFEPFFTTKAADRGTGLGLPTVRGIVEQSSGHVAIDSAPGRGTTVAIYLPRVGAR